MARRGNRPDTVWQIFWVPPDTDRFLLPWSAYVRLLSVKNAAARLFYETEALRCGWSVRQLGRQVNSQFYERAALSRNKADMLQKAEQAESGNSLTPEQAEHGWHEVSDVDHPLLAPVGLW